jgi:hypothetical protein
VVHLQKAGFTVAIENRADLQPIKAQHQVPADLQACHTALIDGYVIEGHVPADLIGRLLRERPKVLGLAVPGMPIGSPGMETPGSPAEPHRVFTFDRAGTRTVFATRP